VARIEGARIVTIERHAAAILPCNDLAANQAFYERLGFALSGNHGH